MQWFQAHFSVIIAALALLGALSTLCTVLGNLLKAIGSNPASRLYHAGDILLAVGLDLSKAKDAGTKLVGNGDSGPVLKVLMLVVVLPLALTTSSCKHLTPTESGLIDCADSLFQAAVPALMPDVGQAIQGRSADWSQSLDKLALTAGIPAVMCAVQIAVEGLENINAAPAVAGNGVPVEVQLIRAHSWLQGAAWACGYRQSGSRAYQDLPVTLQ